MQSARTRLFIVARTRIVVAARIAGERVERFAQRPWLAVTLVGLLSFAGVAGAAALIEIPKPQYHDEFSYLLQADTFARGRLTNPPHPMWVHFETMHVIQQPTYASKFPPAQGLFLGFGQRVFGHPVYGVWLSVAFMNAAICWMLYGWMPPRWALLGGLAASLRFGLLDYWGHSYWGGAVAAAGGALLFGGARRVASLPRTRDAIVMALGAVILANSRPYEGLLASVPVALWFTTRFLQGPARLRSTLFAHVLVPVALVALAAVAAMSWYNMRVTGDAFRAPYVLHAATYRVDPIFLFRKPSVEPAYRHAALREFHAGWEKETYTKQQPIGSYGFLMVKKEQFGKLWRFYLGPIVTTPLLLLPWMTRDVWIRLALVSWTVVVAGLFLETWAFEHYGAPVLGLVVLLILQALKTWQTRDSQVGVWVTWVLAILITVSAALTLAKLVRAADDDTWFKRRAAMLARLEASGEQHLVIVRYAANHVVHNEWVFNAADIDGSAVVWARYMNPESNERLISYFHRRRVWLLDLDDKDKTVGLRPYVSGVELAGVKRARGGPPRGQVPADSHP